MNNNKKMQANAKLDRQTKIRESGMVGLNLVVKKVNPRGYF